MDVVPKVEDIVDFSGVSDVKVRDISHIEKVSPRNQPVVAVQFVGISEHRRVLSPEDLRHESDREDTIFMTYRVPAERMEKAVAFFRSTYCKGRAF